jgi:hypothetical protein
VPDDQPERELPDGGPFRRREPWDSLIERQIREAMRDGAFDDLPHQGAPLPNDANPHAGEWGLAFKMLKDAGYAPPWIEADKDVRELLARRDAILARVRANPPSELDRLRDREQIERLVREVNAAVLRLNTEAPTSRQHRSLLVLANELTAYDEAAGG